MAEQIRKYHFGLTLTSLVVSDLTPALFDKITGVMSTFICLSMSAKDAGRFAGEMSIKRADRDSFNPEALQKLKVGEAYIKTPPLDAAVYVQMPREPMGNFPKGIITLDQLKHRSKTNFGAMGRPQESAAVDQDVEPEDMEEPPDIPPAPKQPPRSEPPKKEPPKRTTQKRRSRFDEDAGEPEIEIS